MYESHLSHRQKLAFLAGVSSKNALSRKIGMDRTSLRRVLRSGRALGPVTCVRIDTAFATTLRQEYGVGALRWPDSIAQWFEEVQRANNPHRDRDSEGKLVLPDDEYESIRGSSLRRLYFSDKLSIAVHDAPTEPGMDLETTIRRAGINMIGALIVAYAAPFLRYANERKQRLSAPERAFDRLAVAAELLEHGLSEQMTLPSLWCENDLRVLIAYIRFNQIAMLSSFRKDLSEKNGGFRSFDDDDVVEFIRQIDVAELNEVFSLYKRGHPSRLRVAVNMLSVASMMQHKEYALAAWRGMAEEDDHAVSLHFQPPGHERPLSESSHLKWAIDTFGHELRLDLHGTISTSQ